MCPRHLPPIPILLAARLHLPSTHHPLLAILPISIALSLPLYPLHPPALIRLQSALWGRSLCPSMLHLHRPARIHIQSALWRRPLCPLNLLPLLARGSATASSATLRSFPA